MSLDIDQPFTGFETLAKAESVVVEGAEITGSFCESIPLLIGDAVQECEVFANLSNSPIAIERFTKRLGPLSVPWSANRKFRFRIDEWIKSQAEFRNNWDKLRALSTEDRRSGTRGIAELKPSVPRVIQVMFPGKGFRLRFQTVLDLLYVRLFSIPRERVRVCPVPGCRKCFVALRLKQTYCGSSACAAWGKKKLKLEYWNRNKEDLLTKRRTQRGNNRRLKKR